MIGEVLALMRDQLNAYLRAQAGKPASHAEDKVQLLDTSAAADAVEFKLGKITALLVNIEQEQVLRPADGFHRQMPDGTVQRVQRDLRLNLYVLFAVRFKVYEQGLSALSQVLRYFQSHPVLDQSQVPKLNPEIDKLTFELVTQPMAEQNAVWSQLRTAYHPSLMYRVRMLVIRDQAGLSVPQVRKTELRAVRKT